MTNSPSATATPLEAARLDWDAATVTLPLDGFGMSSGEVRIVRAAASIEFARCVTGQRQVSQQVSIEAARVLGSFVPDPDAAHWLYGIWNARFVAEHGWKPFSSASPEPVLLQADPETIQRCLSSPEVAELAAISTTVADDGPSKALALAAVDSRTRTVGSIKYRELMDTLEACIKKAGYPVMRDDDVAQVDFPSDASEENLLVGMLASAKCNDNKSITQRAASIEAGFQRIYIQQNEAELTTIKAAANQRIAHAREVLHSVGL